MFRQCAFLAVASTAVLLSGCGSNSPSPPPNKPDFALGGYLQAWKPYSSSDFAEVDILYYSFLTLDDDPDPDDPHDKIWNGNGITETMTRVSMEKVMTESNFSWQKDKIDQMIKDCSSSQKLFMWSIGGWSDLKRTIADDQIPDFTDKIVELFKYGGDGVDLDWEHLSDSTDKDLRAQQRAVVGKTISALRKKLKANQMQHKLISYTSRYNCFWQSSNASDEGFNQFHSDGECLETIQNMDPSDVDWINLMIYDANPDTTWASKQQKHFEFTDYKRILDAGSKAIDKSKIVVGFEPGYQAGNGVWEGFDIDFEVVEYLRKQKTGGIMFWAMNEVDDTQNSATPKSKTHQWQGTVGKNSKYMAAHIQGSPAPPAPPAPPTPAPSPNPSGSCSDCTDGNNCFHAAWADPCSKSADEDACSASKGVWCSSVFTV